MSDSSFLESFDVNRLKVYVEFHKQYPADCRFKIWKQLLNLPNNSVAFKTYCADFKEDATFLRRFPLKSHSLSISLQKCLHIIHKLQPPFKDLDFLPALVFPFVKNLGFDKVFIQEVVLAVFSNWAYSFWEYIPHAPMEHLSLLGTLIEYFDPKLSFHFKSHGLNTHDYGWPLMRTLFSDVIDQSGWFEIWDYAITIQDPNFFWYFLTAFITNKRGRLMKLNDINSIRQYLFSDTIKNVNQLIVEAKRIKLTAPIDYQYPERDFETVTIEDTSYNFFKEAPLFLSNYHLDLVKKIIEDEKIIVQRRIQTIALKYNEQ